MENSGKFQGILFLKICGHPASLNIFFWRTPAWIENQKYMDALFRFVILVKIQNLIFDLLLNYVIFIWISTNTCILSFVVDNDSWIWSDLPMI